MDLTDTRAVREASRKRMTARFHAEVHEVQAQAKLMPDFQNQEGGYSLQGQVGCMAAAKVIVTISGGTGNSVLIWVLVILVCSVCGNY